MSLEPNTPRFVWDRVDGEVVALDCVAGIYFRLNEAASDVWEAIAAGASAVQLLEAGVDEAQLGSYVAQLLDAEALRERRSPADPPAAVTFCGGDLGVERFEDLKKELEADPIHEVDPDKGWALGR